MEVSSSAQEDSEILSSMDLNSEVLSEILDLNETGLPAMNGFVPEIEICDDQGNNGFLKENAFSMLQFENFTMPCFTFPTGASPAPPVTGSFEFITVGILLTTISVFGLLGNVVAIIVLSRPVMKGSFSTLLIGEPTSFIGFSLSSLKQYSFLYAVRIPIKKDF